MNCLIILTCLVFYEGAVTGSKTCSIDSAKISQMKEEIHEEEVFTKFPKNPKVGKSYSSAELGVKVKKTPYTFIEPFYLNVKETIPEIHQKIKQCNKG